VFLHSYLFLANCAPSGYIGIMQVVPVLEGASLVFWSYKCDFFLRPCGSYLVLGQLQMSEHV
jgi:hypothetical protein